MELRHLSCCGIREGTSLSTSRSPEEALRKFGNSIYRFPGPDRFRYVLFSQAGKRAKYGRVFAAFIVEKGLGTVIETEFHKNPNSGHQLKAYLWTVDHVATKAWWTANKAVTAEKEVVNGTGSTSPEAPVLRHV